MSYSYEAMCKLNHRHTKTELAKQLGIERATLYVWLKQFEKDKAIRIQFNECERLKKAIKKLIPSFTIPQLIGLAEHDSYEFVFKDKYPKEQSYDNLDGF